MMKQPTVPPTWATPASIKERSATPRPCCDCGSDIGKGNYYSFDSKCRWCLACGDRYLHRMYSRGVLR
jgi:hypothetical protein